MMAQKTPISLMNELCKANNIAPEYNVIEETGPPHEKTFKVQLNLPSVGSYEGISKTIKGAKHKAAELGLETSGLDKPIRKSKQVDLRPSVKLNSLAMKLGKLVQYQELPFGSKHPGPTPVPSNTYSQYGEQFKPYSPGFPSYGRPPTKMTVSVKVGEKEYFGEGFGRKKARHNAAQNALNDLLKEFDMEIPQETSCLDPESGDKIEVSNLVENGTKPQDVKPIKSEISQVYEIASRQKQKIDFEVISSTGPPHNRMFVTTVAVGGLKATGEGPSKKASKHEASVKILAELIQLPPPPVAAISKTKGRLYNHGGYGKKTAKELDPSLNPISLLGQLRQRRKESLPVYTLVSEEGVRNKEFTVQVEVDTHMARGAGANKKEAKKNAAEAMLQLLGIKHHKPDDNDDSNSQDHKYFQLISTHNDELFKETSDELSNQISSQFPMCSVKVDCLSEQDYVKKELFSEFINNGSTSGDSSRAELRQRPGVNVSIKKGHFYSLFQGQKPSQADEKSGDKESSSEGRQLPPGLLPILPEMSSRSVHAIVPQAKPAVSNHSQPVVGFSTGSDGVKGKPSGPTITVLNRAPGAPVGKAISDEILQNGSTPSMKKLEQLAKSGGFQVHYQDSTQENEQYLAIVTVSTVPQLICRGFGSSLEQAFEHAAANALVPLLQPPSGNGQATNGTSQRSIHVAPSVVKDEPAGNSNV